MYETNLMMSLKWMFWTCNFHWLRKKSLHTDVKLDRHRCMQHMFFTQCNILEAMKLMSTKGLGKCKTSVYKHLTTVEILHGFEASIYKRPTTIDMTLQFQKTNTTSQWLFFSPPCKHWPAFAQHNNTQVQHLPLNFKTSLNNMTDQI